MRKKKRRSQYGDNTAAVSRRLPYVHQAQRSGEVLANNAQNPVFEKTEGSEGESESSSEDDYDSDDPTAELIRETKREMSSRKRESRRSLGAASPISRPINEDANLDRLTSLSGGRKPAGRDMSSMECFKCGQKGHAKADCPNPGRGSTGRGRGRGGRR